MATNLRRTKANLNMKSQALERIEAELTSIQNEGLYKTEREIVTPQQPHLETTTARSLNLCANNYLGLSNHPEIIAAAHAGLDRWGYGLSSVRFICGTQSIHRQLENRLSQFLGMDDAILYTSCFDANGGLFETILNNEDAIISDQLNHASIIDGIRLCKARRFRYANSNMSELETCLKDAADARTRLIATDGVFSMDGSIANLAAICDLADKHDALVMVDDSHAVGFVGKTGRGTHEHHDVMDRIDIITGTLGKALGGASGGYTAARQPIVDLLRQRSRPYLFSNSVAPPIVAASLKALDLIESSTELRDQLMNNAAYFRQALQQNGFDIIPGEHPIIPVMLGDARVAQQMAQDLLERGVFVVGFFYPVVPHGAARIRTQVSAAHTREDLEFAVQQFCAVR
jgi:glycine C-acetyltransferase